MGIPLNHDSRFKPEEAAPRPPDSKTIMNEVASLGFSPAYNSLTTNYWEGE
jgi:hypothetical protein